MLYFFFISSLHNSYPCPFVAHPFLFSHLALVKLTCSLDPPHNQETLRAVVSYFINRRHMIRSLNRQPSDLVAPCLPPVAFPETNKYPNNKQDSQDTCHSYPDVLRSKKAETSNFSGRGGCTTMLTLHETNSSPLNNDGWVRWLISFWNERPIFRCHVSGVTILTPRKFNIALENRPNHPKRKPDCLPTIIFRFHSPIFQAYFR